MPFKILALLFTLFKNVGRTVWFVVCLLPQSPLGKYPSTLGAGYHGDFPEYVCLWTVTNVAYIELMLNFTVFSI